jgi:phage baseplate assembly protein W
MSGLTPLLPLALSTTDGTYQLIKSYKRLVQQNFKNLIMTSPGERMMDPFFGVGIRNFLFENDGQLLYSSIEATIEEQVQKYMPFIAILNISFVTPTQGGGQGMDNNFLAMQIEYLITPLDTVDNLAITSPQN